MGDEAFVSHVVSMNVAVAATSISTGWMIVAHEEVVLLVVSYRCTATSPIFGRPPAACNLASGCVLATRQAQMLLQENQRGSCRMSARGVRTMMHAYLVM